MVQYKKVKSTDEVVAYISQLLEDRLNRKEKILWLVPGGSAINIVNEVAKRLSGNPGLNQLTISLTDERYGPPEHADSNWQQLADKGFNLASANLLPVLNGKGFEETAIDYAKSLNKALALADYSFALGGMGPDGHIFGIKPHSPSVGSTKDALAYEWDDYKRLTLTMHFIKKLNEVIIYAVGEEKHPQFDLLRQNIDPNNQPAQLLK